MKTNLPRFLKATFRSGRRLATILLVIAALVIAYKIGAHGKEPSHETGAPTAAADDSSQMWTCSMHPQIQRLQPGLCPICNMDLIPMAATAGGSLRELTVSEQAAKLMDVEVTPVERRFVAAQVRMVGKIDYDETNLAYITAWVPGRLDRLFVDYTGVTVQKGDHMVSLYSPELISAQEELLQAIQSAKSMQDSESTVMRRLGEETVTAVREKLRLWGLTEEQIAEIERSGKVQDHVTIYAPTGGIVIHKNAVEGMYVQTGTRIYTIADLSKVWVKLDAYESDLEWLRYGQEVQFTTVSYPGSIFRGVISFIDPVLDEKTRTVKVRINVDNADGRLKPGMFVKAVVDSRVAAGGRVMDADMIGKWICPMHPEVIKDEPGRCDICEMPLVTTESLGYVGDSPELAAKPLVIPVSAALITGTRAVVYVKKPDTEIPTFEGREILLGSRAGDYYLVRSGLKEGELVVTAGNFKIDSSLQISAKPSMMTPDAVSGAVTAGHQHGAEMPEMEEAMPGAVMLPPLAAHQVRSVIAAAQGVGRALESREPAKIRAAFGQVAEALETVDMSLLTGDAHMLWMEYRMRLRNDAIEGMEAETFDDMQRVARSLNKNIDAMAARFGISKERPREPEIMVADTFRLQLKSVFETYGKVQTALAEDNAQDAKAAAENLSAKLNAVNADLLPTEMQEPWTKTARDIAAAAGDMKTHQEIVKLREDFYLLSQTMIQVVRRFGAVGETPLYIVYCPMAFENRGASWLQTHTEVRNPYFGATMLQCGEIKEVIEPRPIWKESETP